MSIRPKDIFAIVGKALKKFLADDCPTMAAALSFTTVFSLPSLLTIVLMLVSVFADPAQLQKALTTQTGELIGPSAAEQIQTVISSARRSEVSPSLAAILGSIALLLGATAAFAQLQAALNRAWNVKPDPGQGGLRTFLAKRVLSFGVVLAISFLLLVSLTVTAILSAAGEKMTTVLGVPDAVLAVMNAVISLAVITALFAAMFKILPDATTAWRDVWIGAGVTALLFVGGKELIGLYLGRMDPGSAFGAAGSLVVVLVWLYYSSMIVLFGAELTRIWAENYGRGVEPETGAMEVVQQERRVKTA